MLPLLLPKIAPSALKVAGVVLVLLAAAGIYAYGATQVRSAANEAYQRAVRERDAHWTAEIERSNAAVAQARFEQAKVAFQASVEARQAEERIATLRTDLEKANAALPNAAACGLDASRSRLLNSIGPRRPN